MRNKKKHKHLPRTNTEFHGNKKKKNKQKISHGNTYPLGAKSKGSNGGVAVGLPHRNSSGFKQTHINQREVKVVEVKTRASEAKGPFPGGKRVGSWGKKK